MPTVKYNQGIRFVQNVCLSRGNVAIADLTNSRGQPFNIPYGVKVDLLSSSFGFSKEAIEGSMDLYAALDQDMLEVITDEQYNDEDWNSDMLQPTPRWEVEADVKDLRNRGEQFKAPPNEYDLALYELKKEEDEANKIELERQDGMVNVDDYADMIEYRERQAQKKTSQKGKAGFTNY